MYHLTYLFCQKKESMTAHLDSPNYIFPESLAAVKCPSFPLATEVPKSPEHEKGKTPYKKAQCHLISKGLFIAHITEAFSQHIPQRNSLFRTSDAFAQPTRRSLWIIKQNYSVAPTHE